MRTPLTLIILSLLAMISVFFGSVETSAKTVSGETQIQSSATTTQIKTKKPVIKPTTTKTPATKYYTGAKGSCYTLVLNKKTKKMVKRYVDKKFCVKK